MSVGLNASQARAKSQQDMIIFNEVTDIMRAIIEASGQGLFELRIDDGTYMTASRPTQEHAAGVVDAEIVIGQTVIINGYEVTLGITGTNVGAVVADINDAGIPGVTAKKEFNRLVLVLEAGQSTIWSYSIGAGTANTALGLVPGDYLFDNPPSLDFFSTWQGVTTDRAKMQQMDQVIKYFRNIGFKIERLINPQTQKTMVWSIYW